MKENEILICLALSKLGSTANEHGMTVEFLGHLIGAFATVSTELSKFNENKVIETLELLSELTIAPIEAKQATKN